MTAPLVVTKLYAPPPPAKAVLRPRLIERLNEGPRRRLTLISAPAGFGKSTLVSEWAAGCGQRVAWLSLDEGDSDPARFLTYLVAALQTISQGVGEGMLGAMQAAQPLTAIHEFLLATLLNEIAAMPEAFMLVLDDYHLIDSEPIDHALAYLLDHLPPQMRLVLATREDPSLPLARYRGRGQLTELRAAELRFTAEEAGDFLNRVMGLELSAADVAALEGRTEGWIAGLQLAALSLQGRQDVAGFLQAFTGSHRFVLDYLVEEVLQHQPERVREFLLQTAILDRLCAPLCDAVTEWEDGKEMLDGLERGNLFLVPLDDRRLWFRYHQLFGDVLRTFLREAQPGQVAGLHRRASAWYEKNGLGPDAIRHALAAGEYGRAAGLIELAWSAMDISYQFATWLGWVRALPEEAIRTRPVLSAGYAWALLDSGELEAVEARLQDAERRLDGPADSMVVADDVQFRSLPASIATARAYRSLASGNVPDTVKYARQALDLVPEDDQTRYIQATSLLGLAQYANGELAAAERSLADFTAYLRKIGDVQTLIGITFLLCDIRVGLGRLHEAESGYQQAIGLASSQGEPMPFGTADLYRGLAELAIEWGDLQAAAQHLLTARKLGEQSTLPGWPHRLCVSQARLLEARGEPAGALALLEEAERVYVRSPLPDVRPLPALKARIAIKLGRPVEPLGWARAQAIAVDDELRYMREFEHITLARLLIARAGVDGDRRAALSLLARLLQAAEEGGRNGSVIEILILQALAQQAQGNQTQAQGALERALALAEPEGYVWAFVNEGEALRRLIEKQTRHQGRPLSGYADRLLAAFAGPAPAPRSERAPLKAEGIEPLSERELEVLRLLRSELSGPEIARELTISLNTLRTHTKNIYGRLGVNSRRAAVRRAEELGLF